MISQVPSKDCTRVLPRTPAISEGDAEPTESRFDGQCPVSDVRLRLPTRLGDDADQRIWAAQAARALTRPQSARLGLNLWRLEQSVLGDDAQGGWHVGLLSRMKARADELAVRQGAAAPGRPLAAPHVTAPTAPAVRRGGQSDVWLPAGQAVTVHGVPLYGGLLHVGEHLLSLGGWSQDSADASLIRPSLKVDLRNPDDFGVQLGYWPNYSGLSPQTRAGYLRWLSAGRKDVAAPIGFVFLYFYGLERRLLVDLHKSPAADAERPVLLQEVRRLLDLYGHNGSIRGYLGSLLAYATPVAAERRYLSSPTTPSSWSGELPFDVALGIGQLIADGLPIPAEWAQAWWQAHPTTRQRIAVQRCPQEFTDTFSALYSAGHGSGMVLKPNKRMLTRRYHPASPSLPRSNFEVTTSIPDVRELTAPVAKIDVLAQQATELLAAYSRYVGKNPARHSSPQALALLPSQIQRQGDANTVALMEWAASMVEGYTERLVRVVHLTSRWDSPKFVKADAEALASLLARHDIGIEPDVSFGGSVPKPDSKVVLFRRGAGATQSPSPGYLGARALIQLAGAVATADGSLREVEMGELVGQVSRGLNLPADEQGRLRAHLLWVTEYPVTPAALRKKVSGFTEAQKEAAARLLVAVAAADGTITPAEVDVIAGLFVILGFEATDAYAQVHALATGQGALKPAAPTRMADPLTDVKTQGDRSTGYALPPRPPAEELKGSDPLLVPPLPHPSVYRAHKLPEADPFTLDLERLERTRRDSEQVAALLAGIFEETPYGTSPEPEMPADLSEDPENEIVGAPRIAGLDAAHTQLLLLLAEQPMWSRQELGEICTRLGLLPDGALDTLNEAALDAIGDFVCEGSDPVEMNGETLREML
jgi:tellurite resistance protein